MVSLWSAVSNEELRERHPGSATELPSSEALEAALAEMSAKQEACPHDAVTVKRFGPSYSLRRDGSFRVVDDSLYFCGDCGYVGDDPSGPKFEGKM